MIHDSIRSVTKNWKSWQTTSGVRMKFHGGRGSHDPMLTLPHKYKVQSMWTMISVWCLKKLFISMTVSPNRWLWQENDNDDQVTRILRVVVRSSSLVFYRGVKRVLHWEGAITSLATPPPNPPPHPTPYPHSYTIVVQASNKQDKSCFQTSPMRLGVHVYGCYYLTQACQHVG